jgi:hypothetical protein
MRLLIVLIIGISLAGCATSYGKIGFSGGYKDTQVAADVYRITFSANGFATSETAQTYWLYRAAELTLEKGFDGFEIVTPIFLGAFAPGSNNVCATFIYVPMPSQANKPYLEADIHLLKSPIEASPPKIFDARALKIALDPSMIDDYKCDYGNVCPHIKDYLHLNPQKKVLKNSI